MSLAYTVVSRVSCKSFCRSILATAITLASISLSTNLAALPIDIQPEQIKALEEISISSDQGASAMIVVSIEGQTTRVEVPKLALDDKNELEAALAGLPDDIRASIMSALADIDISGHFVKIKHQSGEITDSVEQVLQQFNYSDGKGGERVIVIDKGLHTDGGLKIIKHLHHSADNKLIETLGDGSIRMVLIKDSIIELLSSGDFNQQALDEIQQMLDDKR